MDISANPNFTIELTNLTSTTGYVLFDFFNNSDRFTVAGPAHRRSVALVPGLNRVSFRLDGSNTNIRGFLLRTSNYIGGLDIDNLRVGFALPTNISLLPVSNPLMANTTVQFSASLNPVGIEAEYTEVNWSVTPSSLATITGQGVLHIGGNNGLVVVRAASAWSGSVFVEQTFTVTVGFIPVTDLSIDGPSSLTVTGTPSPTTYVAQIFPSNASNADVSWSLVGTGATLSSSDLFSAQVTPISDGVVTLTAVSLSNGSILANKIITISPLIVVIPMAGITVSGAVIVTVGGSASYTATIMPTNATNLAINWSLSPPDLATITGEGVLFALGKGLVTITAVSIANSSVIGILIVELIEEDVVSKVSVPFNLGIQVYPNPASDVLYVLGAEVDSKVYIYDLLGNEVLLAEGGKRINITTLPNGLYQMHLQSGETKSRFTIIKQ